MKEGSCRSSFSMKTREQLILVEFSFDVQHFDGNSPVPCRINLAIASSQGDTPNELFDLIFADLVHASGRRTILLVFPKHSRNTRSSGAYYTCCGLQYTVFGYI